MAAHFRKQKRSTTDVVSEVLRFYRSTVLGGFYTKHWLKADIAFQG